MFKKMTFAAFAIATMAATTQIAAAQPGIANLANATPAAAETTSGVVKAGFRRRGWRIGWRHRRHWGHHYGYHARGCYWYLHKYHRTGNPYWKRKFYWCKY